MKEFKVCARKWGDSLGIVIPRKIVEEEKIRPEKEITVCVIGKQPDLRKIFGSLKGWKKSAQQLKDEARAGWEPEH